MDFWLILIWIAVGFLATVIWIAVGFLVTLDAASIFAAVRTETNRIDNKNDEE